MAEQDNSIPNEVTQIKAMTNSRSFAEMSNLNAVLIEEEEPELTAKEVRQQITKQNEVIADMQAKMNQVIALMMSKETAATTTAATMSARQTTTQPPPADCQAVRQADPASCEHNPPEREDLTFLEQHLSPLYRAPPKRALHQSLCPEIMAEHLSGTPPTMPMYNGTTDPEDHVSSFCLRMQLQTNSSAALCRTFPSTFSGICLDWYNRLPNGIIRTYEEFILLFTTKFASQKRRPLLLKALIDLKQKDGESLRAFYARWSRTAMAVRDLTPETAAHHLMEATTNAELKRALAKRPVISSSELETKIEKAVTLEETLGAGSVRRYKPTKPPREEQRRQEPQLPLPQYHSGYGKQHAPQDPPQRRRSPERCPQTSFTPLNDSVKNIFHLIREKGYRVNWPAPIRAFMHTRDHRKHYDFHREPEHLTEDCFNLRVEIEGLIRRGYLAEYVSGAEERKDQQAAPLPSPPQADYNETTGSYIVRKEIGVATIEGDRPKKKTKRDRAVECATTSAAVKCDLSFGNSELPRGIASEESLTNNYNDAGGRLQGAPSAHRRGERCGRPIQAHLDQMDVDPSLIQRAQGNLVGFSGTRVAVIGEITLPIVLGDDEPRTSKQVQFTIVDCNSPHNDILGRPFLAKFMALASTCHQKLKFPTKVGTGESRGSQWSEGNQQITRPIAPQRQTNITDTRANGPRPESMDSDSEVALNPGGPDKKVCISTHVPGDMVEPLVKLLQEYQELFAWCTEDMPGVSRHVAQHCLAVPDTATPRQQKRRIFTGEKLKAIVEEVARLLAAGLIRAVKYPKWLANVVLVKKTSHAWRMCVDYTTINKVCPGDPYPLPLIDQLIDATSNHETLSFLDMFSGYHQIPMSREDEEKTAFMTPFGNFCFTGISFGLKNAGATYQQMIDTVFAPQIGRNIEAYVDDLIVKTKSGGSHLEDLRETFEALRKKSP
ncbi:unnamed protein product [Linum trigynum]|uniref:Reverse transcriptase domain-containing protein n=1 Tax=Linum trigynum TaxID=586398 RepID=A0AAV2DSD7_9ROSI